MITFTFLLLLEFSPTCSLFKCTRQHNKILFHYILNEHITAQRTVNLDAQYSHSCCINHYCQNITMIQKPIIFSFPITFLCYKLLIIINKRTVQVTSKGLCSSVSSLVNNESGSKHGWIATLAPPPLSSGLLVLA